MLATDGELKVTRQLRQLPAEVGVALVAADGAVAVLVDRRHLLECGDLGHVEGVDDADPTGLRLHAGVAVHREVAERVCRRGRRPPREAARGHDEGEG